MLYVGISLIFILMGFMLYFITEIEPLFRTVYLDYIALFVMVIPTILLIYVMFEKRVIWFLEKVPKGKLLVMFLRRDGSVVPVLGTRAYPGESYIDVPRLGLIHDLGNIYHLGANNMRFALENVNHTAEPKYANFTSWLYKLGFNNIKELKATIEPKKTKDKEGKIIETNDSAFPEKEAEVLEKLPLFKATSTEVLVDELLATTKEIPKETKEEKERSVGMAFIDSMRKKDGQTKG